MPKYRDLKIYRERLENERIQLQFLILRHEETGDDLPDEIGGKRYRDLKKYHSRLDSVVDTLEELIYDIDEIIMKGEK